MEKDHFSYWRYLKFIAVFLLLCPISILVAQEHISIKGKYSLKEAIQFIERNSEYTFFYKDNDLKGTSKKNINYNGTIDEVLTKLFTGSNVRYIIKGKEIIFKIIRNDKVKLRQGQKKRIITGTVIDSENKEPIIGANIWLRNSSVGTITNVNGEYSITVEGLGGVLEFTYIGMKKQEVVIGDQVVMNVTLLPDTEVLDEVVVVGYGHQKKESVVGAISILNTGRLIVPGALISNVLAGQLAGIVSMQASGEPGKNSASDFYIRGISSFTGNTSPLVLVDGIERELDLVDVDDIATFSILKDASASAVYGVRGANGVILITTKKGSEGKPRINIRTEFSVKTPTRMPKMADAAQWAEMWNEAKGLNGTNGGYALEEIEKYKNGTDPDLYPNVNWLDEMYRNLAMSERVAINFSGGGDICKYYVSGGFYNEGSIFRSAANIYSYDSSIHYNRFNFRANMDFSITPTTVLNASLANIYEGSWGPGTNAASIWSYAFMTSPNAFPVEYSDGTISSPSNSTGFNPWNLLVHSGYREQCWNSVQSLVGITQKLDMITSGLVANIKFSWDTASNSLQVRSKTPIQYHATGRDKDGNLIYGNPIYNGSDNLAYETPVHQGSITTYMEGSLNYDRIFAQKHHVGLLFLYNHKILKNTHATTQIASLPYKSQGLAGRVTYAYDDRYFAEFNMGYTGSENFARGHRFGFFPAYAIGWMVSNEKWFRPAMKVMNELKLKASYGKVGNDDIGTNRRWAYEPTVNTVGTAWHYGATANITGTSYRIGEVENLNVSWEEATKINIGIETRLFDKISIQTDYFYEKREGIFLKRDGLPAIAGLSTIPYTNIGKTKIAGVDGTIEYEQQIGKVLLTGHGNFTFSRNQLVNNDQPDWQYKYQNVTGKPFGRKGAVQRKGLIALGYFESQEEIDNSPTQMFGEYRVGDVKYKDVNGDGKIDSYDQVSIGYTDLPEITYGFGITAKWKSLDISLFFQGVAHTSLYLGGESFHAFSSNNDERAAIYEDIYNYSWKTTNTAEKNAQAKYPRLSYGTEAGSLNNKQSSTVWLRDRSFFRLKNAEIGYTFPLSLMNRKFIKALRLYVAGTNLLTFSEFKLWDPELLDTSDGSKYPNNCTITFGINAKI